MSCSNCNQTNIDCNCVSKCQTPDCSCAVFLTSDCTNNVLAEMPCLNIEPGKSLTEFLETLDTAICDKFDEITSFFELINVGTGNQLYAGIDNVGRKKIRTLTEGFLVNLTTNTNDITIAIDQDALDAHVQDLLNSPCVISDTLTVTEDGDCIRLEIPEITDIKRFIVNSDYTGDEELGTPSKPFKTIAAALIAYVGTGSAILPEFIGATIVIQKVGSAFTGHFNYNGITVQVEPGVQFASNPTAGWLIDLTTIAIGQKFTVTLDLGEGSLINLQKSGVRNPGTNINTGLFTTYKSVSIKGTGLLYLSKIDTGGTFPEVLIESNSANTAGYYNDSVSPISVTNARLLAETQPIYKLGGFTSYSFNGVRFGIGNPGTTINTGLVPFQQTGGQININNANIFPGITLFTMFKFTKANSITCETNITNSTIDGNIGTLFENSGTNKASLKVISCNPTTVLNTTTLFASTSVLWNTVLFNYNTVSGITNAIDVAQIDLTSGNTISVHNKIGADVVESLRVFSNRASAKASGLPMGSAFISRRTIPVTRTKVDVEYSIATVGSTNFITYGATSSTVNLDFVKNSIDPSADSGGGTVNFSYRDIVV